MIHVGDVAIGETEPLVIIAGPCVIEGEAHTLGIAQKLKEICESLGIRLIFKASYDKANRMSAGSYRGPGLEEGLRILKKVKDELGLPVYTDVHTPEQANPVAEVCDALQLPAFLCRQTDLTVALAKTGRPVFVKKGQFMAPEGMKPIVEKIRAAGNDQVVLIDRGVSFGYGRLISDMRAIPIMQSFGCPVCFDATHSVQLPGGHGGSSGGEREFVPTLAKAAIAAGANLLFMETHPNPANAESDRDTMLPLAELPNLLRNLKELYELTQRQRCSASLSS